MSDEPKFRFDPLYRVIDETEEMRFIEGNFKALFDKLKGISNLGVVTEVFEMAKYPKYEHSIGTVHQVNSLLDVNKKAIPDQYIKPLRIASLFLHVGHFPFTYSTERALLLACNSGKRERENYIKDRVERIIEEVLIAAGFEEEKKDLLKKNLFSLKDCKELYKYFSLKMLMDKFSKLKSKFNLDENALKIIIKDIIDSDDDGHKFLSLADKADFVQRDALYFGTIKLDISPKHLYGNISAYDPKFSISEQRLIESNLEYISERFYNTFDVIWFSRLYEKILARLIISKKFEFEWLEKYNDEKFKRLITENFDETNKKIKLPVKWVNRAKELFDQKISFALVFNIKSICFQKSMDILDVEYKLLGRTQTKTGLLEYPFEEGLLFDISYYNNYSYPVFPNFRVFSINVFQDNSKKNIFKLLDFIKTISHYLPLQNIPHLREALAVSLSTTKRVRFANESIIKAIVEAIMDIEKSKGYEYGHLLDMYQKSIFHIKSFRELWTSYESFLYIFEFSLYLDDLKKSDEKKINETVYQNLYIGFVKGFLSLPVKLLQYEGIKRYIADIRDNLFNKMISIEETSEHKGTLFEAVFLLDKIVTIRGKFKFYLNDLVLIDPEKPRNQQDSNEYDLIEFIINDMNKPECWMYECSIANDYEQNNRDKLTAIADMVHSIFPDLKIRTRYVIPRDKSKTDYYPHELDTGRNFN
jgi:HD superfamily phosphohydrolase